MPSWTTAVVAAALVATACGGAGTAGDGDEPAAPAVDEPAAATTDSGDPTDEPSPADPDPGTADDDAGGETPSETPSEPPADAPAADPGVLGFTATTIAGEPIDLSVYAGSDVILWFWAPW